MWNIFFSVNAFFSFLYFLLFFLSGYMTYTNQYGEVRIMRLNVINSNENLKVIFMFVKSKTDYMKITASAML